MNVLQIIQVTKAALALVPVVIEAIKTMEAAIGPGNGATKLAAVRAMVEGAYNTGNDVVVKFDSVWAAIAPFITAMVPFLTKK